MLHIINKSPLTNSSLDSCLRVASPGYPAYRRCGLRCRIRQCVRGQIREAMGRFKVYVLQPDLEARGLADRIIAGIMPVDYGGFVDLTTANKNCQSWL